MAGDYEALRINIDYETVNKASKAFEILIDKVAEGSSIIEKSGWGNKELKVLTQEVKGAATAVKAWSSAVNEMNKSNQAAALGQEKIKQSVAKTAFEQERAAMATERHARMLEKQAQAAANTARPFNQLNRELQDQFKKLQDAAVKGNVHGAALDSMVSKYRELEGRLRTAKERMAEWTREEEKAIPASEMLKNALGTFFGMLASRALEKATSMFREFAVSVSRAGIELDALQNTMLAATGGWEQGGREIKWVIDMSNRLGLAFGDVSDSYAKFMTSFTRSGGTITQSRQIFEDLSTAMVSLHLPAERMQGVFVALEQMANKGTVQAEELKRQLGNALPGAFELAAESMGILPSKLMDLMKKGEVFSKDFLPAFAATVKSALGQSIDIASMQFNASINRLATSTDLLKMNVGQLVNNAILPFVNGLVGLMGNLAKVAQYFNENAKAAALLKGAFLGLAASISVANWSAIAGAISATTKAVWSLVTALSAASVASGGLPIIIGAIVTGVSALGFYISDTAKKADDISPYVGLAQQYTNLTKEVLALNDAIGAGTISMSDGQKQIEDYKKQFPELTEYVLSTGKSFQQLTNDELKHIVVLGEHDARTRAINERTKEMASWQATLAAACQVYWRIIVDRAKVLGTTVLDIFKAMIDRTVSFVKTFANIEKLVGRFLQDIGGRFGVFGISTKAVGKILETSGSSIDNLKLGVENLGNSFNKGWQATKNWASQTSFAVDVLDQKTQTANDNLIKKLQLIDKNGKTALSSLKTAQVSVAGLTSESEAGGKDQKSKKAKTAKSEKADTEWDKLTKEISATEEAIKVRMLSGKSIDDLLPKYARLKKQQDDINQAFKDLNATPVTGWEKLKKDAAELTKSYEYMLANSQAFTRSEIEQARALARSKNAQIAYTEAIKNLDSALSITSRNASKLTDAIVDGLLDPLAEGETIWTRFKDAGISAIKSIASEWIKQRINLALKGGFAGFAENATGNRFTSSLHGLAAGLIGEPLEGYRTSGGTVSTTGSSAISAISTGMSSIKSALGFGGSSSGGSVVGSIESGFGGSAISNAIESSLGVFDTQATSLAASLTSETLPAVSNTVSAISGVMSPATQAASSVATMASAAPMAALGFGGMSAAMTALSPAAVTAAPALVAMGGALATIAANATAAATAMAALATATAAESVAKIPFAGGFLAPIAAAATSAAIASGAIATGAGIAAGSALGGIGQMVGGVFSGVGSLVSGGASAIGRIIPHAKGGIVSSPTMFPMQGGNIGLAGEAGSEVIAPARRMSNGDVGIGAVQPKVTVNNYANAAVEVIKRPDNEMEIKITELNAMLSSSRTNKGMIAAQSRMNARGRQIG